MCEVQKRMGKNMRWFRARDQIDADGVKLIAVSRLNSLGRD